MLLTIPRVFFNCLLVLTTAAICLAAAQATPPDGRIVGGWETSIANFPHQVSLRVLNNHVCGASLIDRDLVLTAAHCVARYGNPKLFTIRAGSSYIYQGGVVVPVKAIKMHENYGKPGFTSHDIALLKLAQPLTYNSNIQPINILANNVEIGFQEQLWVSGWGAQVSSIPQMSPVLRYTVIHRMDLNKCQQPYQNVMEITANMLCAGVVQGGRDSCQGDSGGPLVVRFNNTMQLMGIVSFGADCAQPGYPGVYTKVQNYHAWLNKTMAVLK